MNHNKFFYFLLVTIGLLAASCNKNESDETTPPFAKSEESVGFHLGKRLDNPYSVENMQRAYDSLLARGQINSTINITATHLYIKLTPQDSVEMNKILADATLELFPYPLDYEIYGEGEFIVDDDDWVATLYTVIPINHQLDNGINYTILEYCYIPEDNGNNSDLALLEMESLRLTGNLSQEELNAMQNMRFLVPPLQYPNGYVTVYNTNDNVYEAVRNIKVRTHRVVKISSAYTDANGYYSSSTGFRWDVHYSAVFENSQGFKVWSNLGPFSPAIHNVGWHDNAGYNITIGSNSCAWPWATINNAALDYYNVLCPYYHIQKPYNGLRFWYLSGILQDFGSGYGGSAPMLRNLTLSASSLAEFLFVIGILESPNLAVATAAAYGAMLCLPDIFVCQIDTIDTRILRRYIFHEMSHASHYAQVGPVYWVQFVTQICYNWITSPNHNAYGSAPNNYNNIIGVGEMWASYFAYKCTDGYYHYYHGLLQQNEWYAPQILKKIEDNSDGITPELIYDALIFPVQSHQELKQELISLYGQSAIITQAFSESGF